MVCIYTKKFFFGFNLKNMRYICAIVVKPQAMPLNDFTDNTSPNKAIFSMKS